MRRYVSPAALLCVGFASVARADVAFGPDDVPTIFFADKSDDRNRVDYGIRLDAHCRAVGGDPMVVYWREFEGGHDGHYTHDLNFFEGMVYGLAHQHATAPGDDGVIEEIQIHAIPRGLTIHTHRVAGHCVAEAHTMIDGRTARLVSVHLTLGDGPGSLRFGDLIGEALDGSGRVAERIMH